ncbi:hypothetical protein D0N36_18270 [Hymenobacter lapidiphilus]|uniref:hypothetical protein n=1 Tax=Hymenobacter sp. CCM 8763 TaxID=2303334 RepID=UPI000E354B28|nr:hypothetical protein [Hymenobacter sp. CCM 8763]RFP63633.1 hypothetical protein D0N36_18270 [Hymenobacter sp. CCM 8763]
MPKNFPDLHVVAETNELLLGHTFEDAVLVRKRNGEYLLEDDFYGDPSGGLIGPDNEWAVVVGEHLTVWHHNTGVSRIEDEHLRGIQALRLVGQTHVEFLVDPWGLRAAIWCLRPSDRTYVKVRDFLDYRDREYTE